MTPTEVITAARRAYNADDDTFWTEAEFLTLLYEAQMELVHAGLIIEKRFSTTTVVNQREYDYPANIISIKRITYDGEKLHPIDFRDDDAITINNSSTTDTGSPLYYQIWDYDIHLRPIPDDTKTLEIWGYAEPIQLANITSALEVPSEYHPGLKNYLLKEMAIKDTNQPIYREYEKRWNIELLKARKWKARRKRGDSNAIVKNEEMFQNSILGVR